MNNRDIDQTPTQLSLDFTSGVGTGHETPFLSSFDYIRSITSLFQAWSKFSRGKRSRLDVLVYERSLEENILELADVLQQGQFQHGPYVPFTIWDPKQRQIHKATVQDRLIHQAIVSGIEPLFERQFIHDSYSCRKYKGTHAAVNRLRHFLNQASHNNTQTVYALKCDVKQFFASVDHKILVNLLNQQVGDARTINLLNVVINSFSDAPGKGIPLGNLTSQLFANVYLHQLDWFMKHGLRERFYIRYCDDFIVLSTDRQHLLDLVEPITRFLQERLALTIHPHKVTVRSWNQGVDFLGYVLKPHHTVLRHKTKQRALRRVSSLNLSSYLGLCSHADAHELGQLFKTKVF